jgi:hypothetical protein
LTSNKIIIKQEPAADKAYEQSKTICKA